MDELTNETKAKIIDIFPLNKWKRILVFVCDYIICLFATFFVFNIACYPLGKVIGGYSDKYQEKGVCERNKMDILYEKKLLFYGEDVYKYKFEANKDFTFDKFLKGWVLGEELVGEKDFDIIKNYFVDVKHDQNQYSQIYYNSELEDNFFFNYDDQHNPTSLKMEYKAQFKPYFDEGDEMSKEGKKNLEAFKNNFFINAYASIFNDIQNGDPELGIPPADLIGANGKSFNALSLKVNEITAFQNVTYISTTLVSYLLCWLILFLIVPMFTKNHKTLAMLLMRVEVVRKDNLKLLRKRNVFLMSLYNLMVNMQCVFFVPLSVVNFNYAFSLTPLLVVSLISFGYTLISLFVILFNSFNRSINDFLTQNIMITSDSLDEIYREKGYLA